MAKFISPQKKLENDESLRRIKIRLDIRFGRYRDEMENEILIGINGSKYYRVKKLENKTDE